MWVMNTPVAAFSASIVKWCVLPTPEEP